MPETRAMRVCLDSDWEVISKFNDDNLAVGVTAENLLYVIYTSGSTGKPKGIGLSHRALTNLIEWHLSSLRKADRMLQFASLSFDASFHEVFATWCSGGTLYLMPEDLRMDPISLGRFISEKSIDKIILPVVVLQQIAEEYKDKDGTLLSLRELITTGEQLQITNSIVELFKRLNECELHNHYGPSETHVVTSDVMERAPDSWETYPSIGRPIANTQIYITDKDLNWLPVGVVGELYIGGDSLARGYINRADLTAERFIPDPFSNEPGARMYKTGDLSRFLPAGTIEFLGRKDHQVKIRGFRVELGEIESVLAQNPAVREVVVMAREDTVGDRRLVAYVVATRGRELTVSELRASLAEQLPDYMVPSAFVIMDELPLTPSKKIDRSALPAPDTQRPELTQAFLGPRTEVEKVLAEIWAEVLGLEKVGIQDNFFELGGHSILSIQLMNRVREALNTDLPLRTLFQTPTIAGLATSIAQHKVKQAEDADSLDADSFTSLPAIVASQESRYEPFPLTEIQQAYWIGRSGALELGNVSAHLYFELDTLDLDLKRLNDAWQKLIERHDMLRAIVLPDGQQQILEQVPYYQFETLDLCGQSPELVATGLASVRQQMSHQVRPADQWPLFEIRATRVDDRRIRLHFSLDALTGDAQSYNILTDEFTRLYENPDMSFEPFELSFRDYVVAEVALRKTKLYQRSEQYWKERLETLPPAPDLPLAQNPGSITQPKFARHRGRIKRETWQKLKTRATQVGLTPSGVLLAAFAEVLATWSVSPRFTINLTLFNRLPMHPQVNRIVGDFTSLTLLEVDNSQGECFEFRARRLQERLWDDLDHRYVSGVSVLRELARKQGVSPRAAMPVVFTSTLNLNNSSGTANEAGRQQTEVSQVTIQAELGYNITQTPQVWIDHQVFEVNGNLVFNWDAVEDLFPGNLLQDMFTAYVSLLNDLASDDSTWQADRLRLLPDYQSDLFEEVNSTQAPVSAALLHTLFETQVEIRPDEVAVISSGTELTYGELNRRANRIARVLREEGARANKLVAVVMNKEWHQVVAVMGILKAGAAYLPISAEFPQQRVMDLLEDGEVEIALTQKWVDDSYNWPEKIKRVVIDDDLSGEDENPQPLQSNQDLAYVIYTSGSTGKPKGVMIDHQGAVNTILDINERYGVRPEDRVLALSSLSFDLSVYDIFGVLAAGGTIVMSEAGRSKDAQRWSELIREHNVTIWNSVPALMEMIVEYQEGRGEQIAGVRLVMLSGDWIAKSLPDRIRRVMPGAKVVSLGGATEGSIWSILHEIDGVRDDWNSIPYGKAMKNQRMRVVNHRGEQRPLLVTGEIEIGGIGVAKGYWGDEKKTCEKFVERCGEKVYRTGDKGRMREGGDIEFQGRDDGQVKVGGYRIEIGEIEAAIERAEGVKAAVVNAIGERRGEKRLVAYVVPDRSLYNDESQKMEVGSADENLETHQRETGFINPLARLDFKLTHPGLRKDDKKPAIQMTKPELDESLIEANFIARRSYRKFSLQPTSLGHISQLLSSLMHIQINGSPMLKACYGSAGSLYPIQTYLYVKPERVIGLSAGTYYYDPRDHRLVLLSGEHIDRSVHAPTNLAVFDASAFSIFLIAQMRAIAPLYGEMGRHYATIEAGLMTQLLEMSAPSNHLGLCQVGSLDFDRIRHLFDLEESHVLLHSLVGGPIDERQTTLKAFLEDSAEYKVLFDLLAEQRQSAEDANPQFPESSSDLREATASKSDSQIIDELRRHLIKELPDYMVPAAFVLLEALPLNLNGKVDRNALPSPENLDSMNEETFVAPQTEVEKAIAAILRDVLQVDRISLHHNFFDLGGNSVHMVQIYNKIREAFGKEFPLVKIFEHSNTSSLAAYLSSTESEESSIARSSTRGEKRKEAAKQKKPRRRNDKRGTRNDE